MGTQRAPFFKESNCFPSESSASFIIHISAPRTFDTHGRERALLLSLLFRCIQVAIPAYYRSVSPTFHAFRGPPSFPAGGRDCRSRAHVKHGARFWGTARRLSSPLEESVTEFQYSINQRFSRGVKGLVIFFHTGERIRSTTDVYDEES